MSLLHRYADFGALADNGPNADADRSDSQEDARLEAFENGYQAGWDDSTKAHEEDGTRALSDVAQHLQDMSFTYQEAYGKIVLALEPLLLEFVAKLMPDLARKCLPAQVLQEIKSLLRTQADGAIELAVAPDALDCINDAVADSLANPFTITADPSMTAGRVFVRVGTVERDINLDAVTSAAADALAAFSDQIHKDTQDG